MVIILLLAAGILGRGLMAFLPSQEKVDRLIDTYLTNTIPSSMFSSVEGCKFTLTYSPGTPIIYSWVAANIAGHTKKNHSQCNAFDVRLIFHEFDNLD